MFKNIGFLEGAILLIVLYLVLVNWRGFTESVGAATKGSVALVRTFQGR